MSEHEDVLDLLLNTRLSARAIGDKCGISFKTVYNIAELAGIDMVVRTRIRRAEKKMMALSGEINELTKKIRKEE